MRIITPAGTRFSRKNMKTDNLYIYTYTHHRDDNLVEISNLLAHFGPAGVRWQAKWQGEPMGLDLVICFCNQEDLVEYILKWL